MADRQPKVSRFQIRVRILGLEQEIIRLHIAVDDALGVALRSDVERQQVYRCLQRFWSSAIGHQSAATMDRSRHGTRFSTQRRKQAQGRRKRA